MRRAATGATLITTLALGLVISLSTNPSPPTARAETAPLTCTVVVSGDTLSFLETCG